VRGKGKEPGRKEKEKNGVAANRDELSGVPVDRGKGEKKVGKKGVSGVTLLGPN